MVFSSITFVYAFFPLVARRLLPEQKPRLPQCRSAARLAPVLFLGRAALPAADARRHTCGLLRRPADGAQHRAQEAYSDRHSRPARRKSLRLQISEFLFGEPFRPVWMARTAEADAPHRHQLLYLPDPFVCDRPVPRQNSRPAQLFLPAPLRQLLPAADRRADRPL